MFRYLLFLFLVFSLHAYEDFYDDDTLSYTSKSYPVSYMGMTIQCHWGCDCFWENPALQRADRLLNKTLKDVFAGSFLLITDGRSRNGIFFPWKRDSEPDFKVYDWESTRGLYLRKEPRKTYSSESYPEFLKLASALRRDVRFYFRDVIQQRIDLYRAGILTLKQEQQEKRGWYVDYCIDGELEYGEPGNPWMGPEIPEFIRRLRQDIRELENMLLSNIYEDKSERIERTIAQMDAIYRDIFSWCLANHQEEGMVFNGALENFLLGEFDAAIEQIRFLIDRAEEEQVQEELLAKLHLLKGQIQSEFGLYADAVIGLTLAIQKNPDLKEAYFERASCYFELGDFNRAIEDFLASEMRSRPIESYSQLGLGISAGIARGAGESTLEFIPSIVGAVRGLGNGLWALVQNPAQISQDFLDAAVQCIGFIKAHSTSAILQEMVPELKELVQNYDQLDDFEAGNLIGHVIGKFGMDIFLSKESVVLIKAARDLKAADRLMTLEALASPSKTREVISVAEKHRLFREDSLRKGSLKIHEGKQGKHIVGHPNYEDIVKRKLLPKPSIFEHPDPNRLLRDFAGTGIKMNGDIPFTSGYVEVVDFKEFVGYVVVPNTKEKIATTMGKIHYAKDGAHIVPYTPKGK